MKKIFTLLILVFTSICFGQGLNGELGFNANYHQNSQGGIVCADEYSYFVKQQFQASFYSPATLLKIDTLENIVWEVVVSPQFEYVDYGDTSWGIVEVTEISQIISSESGGVYVLGFARACCDCQMGAFWFIQKFESTGNLAWIQKWDIDEYTYSEFYMSGLSLSHDQLLVNKYENISQYPNPPVYSSIIYLLNPTDGTITDSLTNLTEYGFYKIVSTNMYNTIAVKGNQLSAYDNNGTIGHTISFSSSINDIISVNDTLFVLTSDSILSYSNDLTPINTNPLNGYSNNHNLKYYNGLLHFFSETNGEAVILSLNHALTIENSLPIPEVITSFDALDFNNLHLAVLKNHGLTLYESIQHLDYSLTSSESKEVNRTDIGIVDLDFYQTTLTPTQYPNVYYFSVYASALVKNFGNKPMTECRINHYVSQAICGEYFYTQRFSGFNLLPGDSVWIDLELIHYERRPFSADSAIMNMCVYSSHPNGLVDLNVPNDQLCKQAFLGYLDIPELSIEKKGRKLVQIVDLLGKEIKEEPNTLMIYIYDDGSTEKIFRRE